MNISILCSNVSHPIAPFLQSWARERGGGHRIELVTSKQNLSGGDILFLISCNEIVGESDRNRYAKTLVIHASDLPEGRGWSPHIWQILEGRNRIMVTLLEARDPVDSGDIWAQRELVLEGHELCNEINDSLFRLELELMDFAVDQFDRIVPRPQDDRPPTYYRKRTPEDSRIDPGRPLAVQFDLLRVADPDRFPAFFDYRGKRYLLQIKKEGKAS